MSSTKPKNMIKTERIEKIIELRLNGNTLSEIGTQFNITKERVRQILKKSGVKTPQKQIPVTVKLTRDDLLKRKLMSLLVENTENGCLEIILKRRQPSGYGRLAGEYTHRLAYRLFVSDIPAGMYICHKCDNPPCCNPDHLFIGTASDNMKDRDSKGRNVGAFAVGANNPQSINESIVNKALDLRAKGISVTEISKTLNVGSSSVYRWIEANKK